MAHTHTVIRHYLVLMAMVENFIKDPLTPQVCGTPIGHALVLIAMIGNCMIKDPHTPQVWNSNKTYFSSHPNGRELHSLLFVK